MKDFTSTCQTYILRILAFALFTISVVPTNTNTLPENSGSMEVVLHFTALVSDCDMHLSKLLDTQCSRPQQHLAPKRQTLRG